MKRIFLFFCWFYLLVSAAPELRAAENEPRPNILFVIADDLGARLGCYGDPQASTPHLDALAGRGVLFQNCFTQFATCGPSRASMLSGLYPYETGAYGNGANIFAGDSGITTLPALFRQQGYFTARVGKIFHMGIPDGIGRAGADDPKAWDLAVNNSGWDGQKENIEKAIKFGTFPNPGVAVSHLDPDIADEDMADGVGTREALRLMSEQHPDKTGKPLMLCVGYYRPHPPMIAPRSHWKAAAAKNFTHPHVPEGDRDDVPAINFHLPGPGFNFIPDDVGLKYTQAYYAAIHFVDSEVAKLLAGLEANGLADNTIVVFTGDQGFHLGEHGHWHKSTFFEEASRVPLIIVAPRAKSGADKKAEQQHTGLCGLIDIYPTLCDMARIKPEQRLSGRSLVPILQDPTLAGKSWELTQGAPGGASIRTQRYRYTEWNEGQRGSMLYDLQSDPREFKNLAKEESHQEIVARLKRKLNQRMSKHD